MKKIFGNHNSLHRSASVNGRTVSRFLFGRRRQGFVALCCVAGLTGNTLAEEPSTVQSSQQQDESWMITANARKGNSRTRTGIRPREVIIIPSMPTAPGNPSYSGSFSRYDDSATITIWRESVGGKDRLFMQVAPSTSEFFFCPGGDQFSVMQGGTNYGSALSATRGDDDSVCETLYAKEIFVVDQWSFLPNFKESAAFTISIDYGSGKISVPDSGSVGAGAIVKGTISWLSLPYSVTCINNTRGQLVNIEKNKTASYNCEKAGLVAKPGDNVAVTFVGNKK